MAGILAGGQSNMFWVIHIGCGNTQVRGISSDLIKDLGACEKWETYSSGAKNLTKFLKCKMKWLCMCFLGDQSKV